MSANVALQRLSVIFYLRTLLKRKIRRREPKESRVSSFRSTESLRTRVRVYIRTYARIQPLQDRRRIFRNI